MAKEIELKYRIEKIPSNFNYSVCVFEIEQGYFPSSTNENQTRLRKKTLINNFDRSEPQYKITVKQGTGINRDEYQTNITAFQFEELWPVTEGFRIQKYRKVFELESGLIVELDQFRNNLEGLILAEVEFGSETEAHKFEPPSWFGENVTEDARFSNFILAVNQKY